MRTKEYSAKIKNIKKLAENMGAKVIFKDLGELMRDGKKVRPAGTYSSVTKTITISTVKDSIQQLIAIAHETGHHIANIRKPDTEILSMEHHEQLAYLIGWVVITKVNAEDLVNKETWKYQHGHLAPSIIIDGNNKD